MIKRFFAVFWARLIEYRRDKAALTWSLMFPFVLVCGFGFIFNDNEQVLFKVGLTGSSQPSEFIAIKHIQMINYQDESEALLKLSQHSLDLLVDISQQQYWVNEDSANGYIVERLLLNIEPHFQRQTYNGRKIRYVDWVFPGILGMNAMFSCLFGVGLVIVRYRKNSVLKRLQATPLRTIEFIVAQILSRLIIVFISIASVYLAADLIFDFYMIGSYLRLILVAVLGVFAMISLSLVIAARTESEELTNNLLNFTSWPMIIFSGVWFSLEGSPVLMQWLSLLLPLTHMIAAARDVMFDDATLWDIRDHLFALMMMTTVFLLSSTYLFRWHGSAR